MTITMLHFGMHDYVRKALEHSDMSAQEFADAMGVSRNTVSRWLNGRGTPSKAQLMAISIVTNVSLEWLMQGMARPEGLEPPTF